MHNHKARLVRLEAVDGLETRSEWVLDDPNLKLGSHVVLMKHNNKIFKIVDATNIRTELSYIKVSGEDVWKISSAIDTKIKLLSA